MARERIAIISLYPLANLGGGEFYTLNTLKAVNVTGAVCRLYAVKEAIPRPRPPGQRLQTECLRVFDSECPGQPVLLPFQQVLEDCADFDTIWVHQYLSNDLVFDLIASTASDQTLLFTNLGHEPLVRGFSQFYQPSPNHWCVEISRFASDRAGAYTRQRTGITAGIWRKDCGAETPILPRAFRRRACVVGRVLPHKGVEVTIAGLPKEFELNVIGGLDLDSDYSAHLKQAAAAKQVQFLGAQDEESKTRVLRSSDVLIASSCLTLYNGKQVEQAELLGLVLLEAVAAGVQPIASDLPSFREIMEKLGLTDFIYPQRDSAALRKVLDHCESLTDDRRAELCQQARRRMQEHFLWDDYWARVRRATTPMATS